MTWPEHNLSQLIQSYWDYREELTIHELIFKRIVVIPAALRNEMLKAVHQPHRGAEMSKR
jgi:hypothetical protein